MMRGFKNPQGAFFQCTEIGERNWVLRLVGSGDVGPTARNFTKNPSQRLDTGIIPTPWWFTPECEQQLASIGEDGKIPPSIKPETATPDSTIATLTEEQLKHRLKTQLEYYFSRENLNQDRYLRSQMDNDQYVPIQVVASFPKISQLTSDQNLIITVLKESINVQVDESNTKVRAAHRRCTLLLREIPEFTDEREVKAMFIGCPPYTSLKYGLNNSWYVTFETEEATQLAFLHLQNLRKSFNGKQICVRIKTGIAPFPDPSANDRENHSPSSRPKSDIFIGMGKGISTVATSKGYITGFPATAAFTLNPNCTRVVVENELNLDQLMGPFGYSIRAIFQPKESEPPKNDSDTMPSTSSASALLPPNEIRARNDNFATSIVKNNNNNNGSGILGPPSTQIVESMLSAAAEANETKKREKEVQKQQWQQIMDNLASTPAGGQRITDVPFIKRVPVLHRFVSQESADIEVALDIQRAARKQEKESKQLQEQQVAQQQAVQQQKLQQQQQQQQHHQQQQQQLQQQQLLAQQQAAQQAAQQVAQHQAQLRAQQQQAQIQMQQQHQLQKHVQQHVPQQHIPPVQIQLHQHQSYSHQPHQQQQSYQQPPPPLPLPPPQQPQQQHYNNEGYRQNNSNRNYSDRNAKEYNQYNGYSSGERSSYDKSETRRSNQSYRGTGERRSYDARSDRSSGKSDNYSSSKSEGYSKNENYGNKSDNNYNKNETYYKPRGERNNDRNYNNTSTSNNYYYDRSSTSNYSNPRYEKPRYHTDRRPPRNNTYQQNIPQIQPPSYHPLTPVSATTSAPTVNPTPPKVRILTNPERSTTTTSKATTLPPTTPTTPSSTTKPSTAAAAVVSTTPTKTTTPPKPTIVVPVVIVPPPSSNSATSPSSLTSPKTTTTIVHSDTASTTSSSTTRKKDNSESSEYNFVDGDFPSLVEKQKVQAKEKEKAKFSAVVAGKKNDVKKSYAQTLKRQESKQSSKPADNKS